MKINKRFSRKFISMILALVMIFSVSLLGFASVSATDVQSSETSADTKTIYLSINGQWTQKMCVAYTWSNDYNAGKWIAMKNLNSASDLWSVEIPADYSNITFCSRIAPFFGWAAVKNQTGELAIPQGCDHFTLTGESAGVWDTYATDTEDPVGTRVIYFAPNTEWMEIQASEGHNFVARAYNTTSDSVGVCLDMTLVQGLYGVHPAIWAVEVSQAYTNIEFIRGEGLYSQGDWKAWETTNAFEIPSTYNLLTQDEETYQIGDWSYIDAPEVTEPEVTEPEATEPEVTVPDVSEPSVDPAETKKVYFTPNDVWKAAVSDFGSFCAYAWSTSQGAGTWVWLTSVSGGKYSADIPADSTGIFFAISYSTEPDAVWNQTDNLTIPADSDHFTQDSEDYTTGSWHVTGDVAGISYYVVFVTDEGKLISAQTIAEGGSAVAPEAPEKAADAQYTYVFAGWDVPYDNITANTTVTATYTKILNKYTVTFIAKDGSVIDEQTVEYGLGATAPQAPEVEGYDFNGWDVSFDNITGDLTVEAQYKKKATASDSDNTGSLKIEIAGGNGFKISINGGNARPQGTSYTNTKAPVGVTATVTANTVEGKEFMGWYNPINGETLSTDYAYTFVTSGNDFFKAMYKTDVEGVNVVIFKNDKAFNNMGQIIEMQYYAAGDEIIFPVNPTQTGWDFVEWNMTEEEIKAELAAGNDVEVLATWTVQKVYITVDVIGGTAEGSTNAEGKYLANNMVTLTADAAAAGQKFAYWTVDGVVRSYEEEFSFYPSESCTAQAVFVAEDATVEYEVLVNLDTIDTVSVEGKNVFYYSWYVPEEYLGIEFVKAGVIAVDKDNYKEENMYVGVTATGYYDRSNTTGSSGTFAWTKSSVAEGQTWVAKAYVQYSDSNGVVYTIYSDTVEATK